MKKIVLLAFVLSAACGGADDDAETEVAQGPEVEMPEEEMVVMQETEDAVAAREAITADRVFVDVRSLEEYQAGHVEGAIHIPYDQMEERWPELAEYQDEDIVVYCRTGTRAGIALEVLQDHGFDEAVNGGGLDELEAQGIPTTTD